MNFRSIAVSCDFPLDRLSDPMRAVPLRLMAQLFVAAARDVKDCSLPIKVGEASVFGNTGLLGHLAMSAPTVRTFLECLAGYMPVLLNAIEVGYEEHGGTGRLFWNTPIDFDVPTKPFNLYIASSLVYRIRLAAGDSWIPLAVSFEHKAPNVNERELSVFGSRISFDAEVTGLTVDATTLGKAMPTANEEMFSIFKHHASLLMREVSAQQDLPTQVRKAISLRLMRHTPTLEMVAHDVGLPPRALQRRLERIGVSFEKVLDETRCTIAERLLRETDRPLIQVAHEVGYGSQSTFTRAVRRWLDESPRAYRQRFRVLPLAPYSDLVVKDTLVNSSNGELGEDAVAGTDQPRVSARRA
ncbi:MAG TPA: AraC family transcriptional regulator ligand-binding domain-containing protein [Hyphomicrobiaceae bacterium]|nr:AraC family transcriptional regulator ligand-binding domain-containing protein [Hyphomicrobiaceae bacterium]